MREGDAMKIASYWHDTSTPFAGAEPDAVAGQFDVAVVGAGFTGLSAARSLAKAGAKVAVLEARHVGYGASGRNGGHLNSGHYGSFGAIKRSFGEAQAQRLWKAYDASIDMIQTITEEEEIACDFRRSGKLKLASKASHVEGLKAMSDEIRREVDPSVRWLSREELRSEIGSDAFHGGVLYPHSAMMHMGRYVNGLAGAAARHGARIWENAGVTAHRQSARSWSLETARGNLTAKKVVLATDAYSGAVFPYIRRRVFPVASFIIVTRPLTDAEVAATLPAHRNYTNSLNISNYFRLTPDNRILFGGRARFSAVSNQQTDTRSAELLRQQMVGIFPQLANVTVDYCWGGLVGCTQDRFPRAGEAEGFIYGMGYSGHGAQLSTLIGSVLADLALGKRGTNPLEGMPLQALPLTAGNPWFLPIVGTWYRLKDALG